MGLSFVIVGTSDNLWHGVNVTGKQKKTKVIKYLENPQNEKKTIWNVFNTIELHQSLMVY